MMDIAAADDSATNTDSLVVTPEVRQDEYMQLLRVAQLHRVDCTRTGHPSARDVGKTYREGHIRGRHFGGEYKIQWMNLSIFGSMHEYQCLWNGVGPPTSNFLELRLDNQKRIQRRPFGNRPHGT
jgi:hypothetical protein